MRIFLVIIFIAIAASFGFGFYTKASNPGLGELCIGLAVAGLFFVWMPAFVYHRWRNKDIKNYMLTKENIEKMRKESEDKNL